MHRCGRNGFSSARRRKNSAVGNSWCENANRRSSRKDWHYDRCHKLYRRQTEHELSAELRAFWFAYNPGRNRIIRRRNGRVLAVLDSMEITIKRTAAATAVAAKYLARKNS